MLIFSLSDINTAADALVNALAGRSVVAFHGAMGAGKTTLIAALVRRLGSSDPISSPTFALVNEYRDDHDRPIYHFDFYRIDSPREATDIGTEEYFDSGALCLVEWPEKIESILEKFDVMHVTIDVGETGERILKIKS